MEAAWTACGAAGIGIPDEILDYFGGENPFGKPGAEIDISAAVTDHADTGENGFEVDLEKLPHGLRWIRFVNSY